MISQEYKDYIKSKKWKQKRLERLEIAGNKCEMCGSTNRLQVHHITYKRLGNEDVQLDLVCLCSKCHRRIHQILKNSRSAYFHEG